MYVFFIVLLTIVVLIQATLLFVCIKRNLVLTEKLDELYTQVVESLDVLDYLYRKFSDRAKLELMADTPEVRDMVVDIQGARNAMLLIANKIVFPFEEDEDEDEDEEDEE